MVCLYFKNSNVLNDFKTYIDFILCLLISKICLKGEESIDRPAQWIVQNRDQLGGFSVWIKNRNRQDIQGIFKQILNINSNQPKNTTELQEFPKELESIIKNYPNISFLLIIPPFSRLSYKLKKIEFKNAIQAILDRRYPNVKIYGFDDTDIPDDLSHYIDLVHYDDTINSLMLNAIQNNTHRITSKNINQYFNTMFQKIKDYDIEPLRQQILALPEFKNR